jgi:hypothetical protein
MFPVRGVGKFQERIQQQASGIKHQASGEMRDA